MTYAWAAYPNNVTNRLTRLAAQVCDPLLLHDGNEIGPRDFVANRLPDLLVVSTGLWPMEAPYDEGLGSKRTKADETEEANTSFESQLKHYQQALTHVRRALMQVRALVHEQFSVPPVVHRGP